MTIHLPVTMAEHVDTGLNFNEPLFGFLEHNSSRQKKTRDGLNVPATQEFSWLKLRLP